MHTWKTLFIAAGITLSICLPINGTAKQCLGLTLIEFDEQGKRLDNATDVGNLVVCTKNAETDIVEAFFGNDERFEMYRVRR
ncbi:MAG: hypothetical protein A3F17_08365 [Gammaproteobacteria bacterium RIFCSPHIGHO2_12_FULL_41_15]|nr:MAG: hypothetical protein A3F17_08365 [Gammaproteobacteria bacterium RIFCSPHIGHO2_12_FULL_41_15]